MSLFIAIIIGILVGVGVAFVLPRNLDLILMNVLGGIVGALIGLALYFFSSYDTSEGSGLFSSLGVLASLFGALVIVLLFNLLHRVFTRHTAQESSGGSELTKEKDNS